MKIKTFKFEICNETSHPLKNDENSHSFVKRAEKITHPDVIDSIINDFIADKQVVDIKITTVDEKYHNSIIHHSL